MAWVRVGPARDRLVNLEGFVHIHVVPSDEQEGGGWAVEGLLRDRSSACLLEGARSECEALLDEVALAVWAIEVGAGAETRGIGGAPDAGRGPRPTV